MKLGRKVARERDREVREERAGVAGSRERAGVEIVVWHVRLVPCQVTGPPHYSLLFLTLFSHAHFLSICLHSLTHTMS